MRAFWQRGAMGELLLRVLREGLYLALLLGAPVLVASLLASVVSGLVQSLTQIQDTSLSVLPRLVAVAIALAVASPWMLAQLLRFGEATMALLPALAR